MVKLRGSDSGQGSILPGRVAYPGFSHRRRSVAEQFLPETHDGIWKANASKGGSAMRMRASLVAVLLAEDAAL